jgi:diguanylate cyclase (GGDEF)-like protein
MMNDQDEVLQYNLQQRKTIQEIRQCNEDAFKLHYVDPIKGIEYARRALSLSTSGEFSNEPYLQGVADSKFHLAFFGFNFGNIAEALENAESALEHFHQLDQLLPQTEIYALMGLIYDTYDDRNNAIEYLIRALDIAKREGFELAEGKIHLLIGISYYHMNNYRQCLHSLTHAKQIFEKYNDLNYLSLVLVQLSKAYSLLNQQDLAFESIYEALQIAVDNNFYVIQGDGFYNLGMMHLRGNEYDIAKSHLNYSQRIADTYQLKYLRIKANLGLGQISLNRFETQTALKLCEQSLVEADELGIDRILLETHRLLSEIYEVLHRYKKSLFHFKEYSNLTNKVFNKKSQQKTQTVEVLFRTRSAKLEADFTRRKNLSLEKEIVERKKVEEELRESEKRYQKMASYDPLTNLFNRRHFFNVAEIEFERSRRYQHSLAVMMIDLDHFKSINDRYGHLIGDEMLTYVAGLCTDNLRKIDLIGRYGGEEFIVLLPQTSKNSALVLAKRLCEVIADAKMPSARGEVNITISIGLSVNTAENGGLEEMVRLADQALYQAKNNGRNQVAFLEDGDDSKLKESAND